MAATEDPAGMSSRFHVLLESLRSQQPKIVPFMMFPLLDGVDVDDLEKIVWYWVTSCKSEIEHLWSKLCILVQPKEFRKQNMIKQGNAIEYVPK